MPARHAASPAVVEGHQHPRRQPARPQSASSSPAPTWRHGWSRDRKVSPTRAVEHPGPFGPAPQPSCLSSPPRTRPTQRARRSHRRTSRRGGQRSRRTGPCERPHVHVQRRDHGCRHVRQLTVRGCRSGCPDGRRGVQIGSLPHRAGRQHGRGGGRGCGSTGRARPCPRACTGSEHPTCMCHGCGCCTARSWPVCRQVRAPRRPPVRRAQRCAAP